MTKDPVCGMEAGQNIQADYANKTYYFCSEACRKTFIKEPKKFSR